mmetsp:Transcript_10458/g.14778  ORF Transcript_10458/g.14778 Transcript_10458/m.14778 type:complete len:178 (-) Transcript_10458:410-943(-)
MSSKVVRKLLKQSIRIEDDEVLENSRKRNKKSKNGNVAKSRRSHNDAFPTKKKISIASSSGSTESSDQTRNGAMHKLLQSHVESMLLVDKEFSRRSDGKLSALTRKVQRDKHDEKDRKKLKTVLKSGISGTIGNSRSSSSLNSLQQPERTFNKKRNAAQMKKERLDELAKILKKRKT